MAESKHKRKRRWFLLALAVLLPALWIGYLMLSINAYASVQSAVSADAAIVLGNALGPDDRPDAVFAARIDHAIALYKAGRVKTIIFTGGYRYGPDLTESISAKNYALERGVRAEHTLIETASQTTWQNLIEAKKLIDEHGLGRVLIVSDPLHMKRAMTMARDLDFDAYPSPTTTGRIAEERGSFRFLFREAVYYAGYSLLRIFST
jgi:uncharacterized SAM-binding protein YcdF (DUF218 family)